MTDPTPTLRLWLMDWYGWMLDHDPLRDVPTRTPFQPGRLPGLSAVVPATFQLPCRPFMEKRVSMPRSFPELEMQELPQNRVAFLVPKTGTYLRIAPIPTSSVDYLASRPLGWETFLPLTMEMLRGLSLLMTPDALRLENDTGTFLPTPVFIEEMTLRFGDRDLPLFLNTAALIQIGQIMPGHTARIALTEQGNTAPVSLTVHRQTTPEPATP